MAVKIRCRRAGANNDPCFRIVAADVRSARDGENLEILGWYDPKRAKQNFWINLERVQDWIGKGAKPSEIVISLLKQAKKPGRMAVKKEPTIKVPAPAPTA